MHRSAPLIATAVLAWSAGVLTSHVLSAQAQEPEAVGVQVAVAPPPSRLTCRLFVVQPDHRWTLETSDRTNEVGQWVGEMEEGGWVLHTTDMEVGQKSTGYPQGYLHLCMAPPR